MSGSVASIDHGILANLDQDHHTQYVLLLGRAGGQTIVGGIDDGDTLTLRSCTGEACGVRIYPGDWLQLPEFSGAPSDAPLAGWGRFVPMPDGHIYWQNSDGDLLDLTSETEDHGGLTGLLDDDHIQYFKLLGRTSGQVAIGGTASGAYLKLRSTSHSFKTGIQIMPDDWLGIPYITPPSEGIFPADSGGLYAKSDGRLYWLNKDGEEFDLASSDDPGGVTTKHCARIYCTTAQTVAGDYELAQLEFDATGHDVGSIVTLPSITIARDGRYNIGSFLKLIGTGAEFAGGSITRYPNSATNSAGGGQQDWTSPDNAKAHDGVATSCNILLFGTPINTNYLQLQDFRFNLPSSLPVLGIQMNGSFRSSTNFWLDYQASLMAFGGFVQAENKATQSSIPAGASFIPVVYGGPTDEWAGSWTSDDLNDSSWGFAFMARLNASAGSGAVFVDYFAMTAFFDPIVVTDVWHQKIGLVVNDTLVRMNATVRDNTESRDVGVDLGTQLELSAGDVLKIYVAQDTGDDATLAVEVENRPELWISEI